MFRLAFPFADGEAERKEMAYLERRFDCNLANGGPGRVEANASVAGTDDEAGNASETGIKTPKRGRGRPRKVQPKVEEDAAEGSAAATAPVSNGTTNAVPASGSTGVRLQGTWVPAADAIEIAEEYGLLTYARPLIEARTVPAADGSETPVLAERIDPTIPPGTRPIKRLRIPPVDEVKLVYAYNEAEAEAKRKAASGSGSGSPSVVRTRTTRTTLPDGSEEVRVETTETSIVSEDADEEMAGPDSGSGAAQALSQTEIESQIAQAKALAANVQSSSTTAGAGSTGTKRRATTEASAELDALASDEEDEEEEERGNFQGFATDRRIRPIVRTLRRGARSARARPIATTAGVLTAASAIGAGAAAWLAPASVEAGFQLLQQGVQNIGWGGWFF